MKELKDLNPLLPSVSHCESISQNGLHIETTGPLVSVKWSEELIGNLNSAEEELHLEIWHAGTPDMPLIQKKVTHLLSTEFHLHHTDTFVLRLLRKKKFQLKVSSPFHFTPKVVLVSENEQRHHLSWGEIDWEQVKREVEIASGIDWDKDVELCLHIRRWPGPSSDLPDEEWQRTGLSDHAIVLGALKEVDLTVIPRNGQGKAPKVLKTIFSIYFELPPVVEEVAQAEFEVQATGPFMELKREIWEEDTVQLRAWWRIPDYSWGKLEQEILRPKGLGWDDVEVCIRLFRSGANSLEEWKPEERRPILLSTDWLFTDIQDNSTYTAALFIEPRAEANVNLPGIEELRTRPVIVSNEVCVPARPNQIVLLPVDEGRLFAYWHVDKEEIARKLHELSGGDPSKVRTYIRVFHDWAGGLHHHMDKDAEVHLGLHDNWYLNVEPDRVYRVQLIAVIDGSRIEPLTDVSNPAQTARVSPGTNPISYREIIPPEGHPTHRPLRSIMGTAEHSIGLLVMHLHAHLPFIHRRVIYGTSGIWQPLGYPEEWFHEAIRETYVPLILTFERLVEEGVDFRISMDISPTLCNMMRDPLLQEEFLKYIEANISLARVEVERTRREAPQYHATAWMHLKHFIEVRDCFLRYERNLTRAFKRFQDEGYIEISTCGATHAFLPFFTPYPEAVKAQIHTAVRDYQATFGRDPVGIWLPECAYVPSIERIVEEAGLRYFFTETHAVLQADCPAAFGVHAPVYIKGSNVAAFARDPETGKQVWSGEEGYPGDPDYLEFHIKGGPLKYNRITSRGSDVKEPYVREWALDKAARHAQHFMESRNFRFRYIKNWFWKKPLIVSTYDAELFGHHWYEGPDFLYFLFKKLYYNQNETELTTPSAYLARYPRNQEVFVNASSWGDKGTFDKWMYGSVSWMYRHSHEAIRELAAMARDMVDNRRNDPIARRIVAQAEREVLQSMNSDIPFVISNGHFVDRMKELFFEDLERFWRLVNLYWKGRSGPGSWSGDALCILRRLELENPIFPEIEPDAIL